MSDFADFGTVKITGHLYFTVDMSTFPDKENAFAALGRAIDSVQRVYGGYVSLIYIDKEARTSITIQLLIE